MLKNGGKVTCNLLSVRDTALLVDRSGNSTTDSMSMRPAIYSFSSIDRFHYYPVSLGRTTALGVGVGAVTGPIVGAAITPKGSDVAESAASSATTFVDILKYGGIGILAGAVTGITIGLLTRHSYDPSDPNDREEITKLAIYKTEEPEELKKIK